MGEEPRLVHVEQGSHRFHTIPEVLQPQVFIGGVLVVVVVGDRYGNRARLCCALRCSQRNAPAHGRQQDYRASCAFDSANDFLCNRQVHRSAHSVVAWLIAFH